MSLTLRLLIATACLALGVAVQGALQAHLHRADADGSVALVRPLADLPRQLIDPAPLDGTPPLSWQGEDDPEEARCRADKHFHWADELIYRSYRPSDGGPAVRVYLVYSRDARDREHHPETCIRDWQGLPEELSQRAVLSLHRQESRPVQRFRFRRGPEAYTTVYYWHYSLETPIEPGRSWLQILHRRLSMAAASVTAQVLTTAPLEELPIIENSLLPAIDQAMRQGLLPPTARVGCDRVPMTFAGNPGQH
jgi:hypothetical protein